MIASSTDSQLASRSRFFRVPLAEIGYVRAIVEGYDGLAVLRTPDARRGEIELMACGTATDDAEDDFNILIHKISAEVRWVEIARPTDWDFASKGAR